ncbi:MBL fold metallo-hydrolase [Pseudodesulfovibrio cashew]|uniref:MBL fold metallo-hydrolase n=1 Tax=Pseudodesulfovibrio cashew TaxID=2678688 RepID=A0A6I6JF97_9BACT|nr:MBL fold metallo-hydrolase [Pseudodesulfovibrio cashew]QGY39849.1 MBL fold metallo-hydrolase [Pseudodesulfovibrio cashew]
MRITFNGVGEAFDQDLPNTSLLIESGACSLLADCGFTAAAAFWRAAADPSGLDAVYLSHFHGDHYFGLPQLLARFVDDGRTEPLTILGQSGVEQRVRELVNMAYTSLLDRAKFELRFLECRDGGTAELSGMRLSFALGDHPVPSLSLRVDSAGQSVFYSGDGRPTEATRALAKGCRMIVHESFSLDPDKPGHGTVDSSIDFAGEAGARILALVHVRRRVRHRLRDEILRRAAAAKGLEVLLPEPGDHVTLTGS